MAKLDIRKLARHFAGRTPELMVTVIPGAAASTNIAVAGITLRDGLLAVVQVEDTAGVADGVIAELVSEASITSDGNIQLSSTDTSAGGLLILWWKFHS